MPPLETPFDSTSHHSEKNNTMPNNGKLKQLTACSRDREREREEISNSAIKCL